MSRCQWRLLHHSALQYVLRSCGDRQSWFLSITSSSCVLNVKFYHSNYGRSKWFTVIHDGEWTKFGAHSSMTTDSNPTQKVIIQDLMQYQGKETSEVETANDEATMLKTNLKYACSKPGCQVSDVKFLDKTRCKNPFSHFKVCYGRVLSPSKQAELMLTRNRGRWLKHLIVKLIRTDAHSPVP